MLRKRGPCLRRLVFYGIALLCLCVVMYALGSTMTLWTMEFSLEQTDNPLLEGFSLPTVLSDVTPAMPVSSAGPSSTVAEQVIDGHGLLRPPNPVA